MLHRGGANIDQDCIDVTADFLAKAAEGADLLRKCADDAGILTGIGVGTAFGLLVVLLTVIVVVRLFSERVLDRLAERSAVRAAEAEAESRDKALAAVIAVASLGGDHVPAEGSVDEDG